MSDFQLQYGDDFLPVDGDFPRAGDYLPSFMLVDDQKRDVALERFVRSPKLILTLLSLDEDEHAGIFLLRETRRFAERWPQLKLIVISVDSPSSLARARQEHGLPNVTLLSTLRGRDFHKHYGVLIKEYPLSGYTAPALLLADGDDVIHYAERLANTRDYFNFDALNALLEQAETQLREKEMAEEEEKARVEAEQSQSAERLLEKARQLHEAQLARHKTDGDGEAG
ncbi:thiol peroxidase [Xenophilus sp. AP218F]|nr:redoxin family protein [Chromobacterium sp. ASV5]OWY39795.1 thiol peroxidase [Xenophilus sp. AP218F]